MDAADVVGVVDVVPSDSLRLVLLLRSEAAPSLMKVLKVCYVLVDLINFHALKFFKGDFFQ